MTIKLLKNSAYKVMPWKNGLGTTSQIDIFPEGASFPGEDFLWRISSAQVQSSNPFSQFPGCDRLLAVWQGAGLSLNGKNLLPYEVLRFHGEEVIQGDLLKNEVIDLGIIFNRAKVNAAMKAFSSPAGVSFDLQLDAQVHYLFCAQGSFHLAIANASKDKPSNRVDTSDCLKIEESGSCKIIPEGPLELKLFVMALSRQ